MTDMTEKLYSYSYSKLERIYFFFLEENKKKY